MLGALCCTTLEDARLSYVSLLGKPIDQCIQYKVPHQPFTQGLDYMNDIHDYCFHSYFIQDLKVMFFSNSIISFASISQNHED